MEFRDPEASDALITGKLGKMMGMIYRKKLMCHLHPKEEVVNFAELNNVPKCAVCIYEQNTQVIVHFFEWGTKNIKAYDIPNQY